MCFESEINLITNGKYKIYSISDAIKIVTENCDGKKRNFPPPTPALSNLYQGKDNKNSYVESRYKFPFGIWFRGHERKCYHLKPSLFRDKNDNLKKCSNHENKTRETDNPIPSCYYDETSIFYHFQNRMPNYKVNNYSIFDWLCLMQHYEVPTRVLDWTENILVALFFVVKNKQYDDCDGIVYALNSARLNEVSSIISRKRQMQHPNSLDVILRSALAVSRTRTQLIKYLKRIDIYEELLSEVKYEEIKKWLHDNSEDDVIDLMNDEKSKKIIERIGYPIAVYPNRIIERMALQLSVTTLYGGKSYDWHKTEKFHIGIQEDHERLPDFKSIYSLNKLVSEKNSFLDYDNNPFDKEFLNAFIVPSNCKVKIREELKRIGFHDVSMFPEIEYQAHYIKKQWRNDFAIPEYDDNCYQTADIVTNPLGVIYDQ
ncbi:MAG TPA: FRG domain-containing protein [Chitinispirillaceae bacterium]|nr:FRG domain-containing protein [Chitinispirillaceae bacterium]